MSPLFTGPEFALAVCLGIVAVIGIVLLARQWDRLPMYPPTEDDILPPPNVRSQRQDWDQHEWWQS